MTGLSVNDIDVVKTPLGGYGGTFPALVLLGCDDPLVPGAPDMHGLWQITAVHVNGVDDASHAMIGHLQRIEQRGDRVVITSGQVIHDMRCDGTLENGVHDVAAADLTTEIHVVASFEDGVHVLRPDGLPIEVRRWRDGDDLMWDYAGAFEARLRRLGPPDTNPGELAP